MATPLQPGQKAPDFTGMDQHGNKFTLKACRGKKVVLYFYPADDTPACTVQACNLRDNYSLFFQKGYVVVGISPDDVLSHRKFTDKFQLPFPLIADPTHSIIQQYGVWGEKNLYGRKYQGLHRTTFVISEKGIIEKIFLRPKNKVHAAEIMK